MPYGRYETSSMHDTWEFQHKGIKDSEIMEFPMAQ